MLQHPKGIFAAALLGLPLFALGCSGGGGSSRPRATATPIATTVATATATPAVTATPAPFSLNANFTQAQGALPFAVRYTQGTGELSTQSGVSFLNATFTEASTSSLSISLNNPAAFASGYVYTFSGIDPAAGPRVVVYRGFGEGEPMREFVATSGILRITSLVNNPATPTQSATATVNFTLTNVILQDTTTAASNDLTLNAAGRFTANNLGEVAPPAKNSRRKLR